MPNLDEIKARRDSLTRENTDWLIAELERLREEKKRLKVAMPICPYCNEEMYVAQYNGYYEKFSYWMCACEDNELEEKADIKIQGLYV